MALIWLKLLKDKLKMPRNNTKNLNQSQNKNQKRKVYKKVLNLHRLNLN